MAFERVEGPPSDVRADYHAAQIVQALIAILATKKGKKPPKVHELILDWDPGRPKKSGLQALAAAAAANRAAGGIDTRDGKIIVGDPDFSREDGD